MNDEEPTGTSGQEPQMVGPGGVVPRGWRAVPRKTLKKLDEATAFQYLWHKAGKRIDIRELPGFGEIAARAVAEHRTGMRQDRLYTLWQAVAGLPAAPHPVAEVGAYKGGSARFIAEAMRWHNRSRRFLVCDTFGGHVAVEPALDGPHKVGEQFTGNSADEVRAYLADLPEIELVAGDFVETSAGLEPLAPFAFVHLDVDVYPVMKHALHFFAARVVGGGLIVVDDYGFTTCRGTRQAVDEFTAAHTEYRAFHLLTGQALLVRLG